MARKFKFVPGINIQRPWSTLIVDGTKVVETRSYPIPKKYVGVEIAIIETPGAQGIRDKSRPAKIVGTVVFENCFQYNSKAEWKKDFALHLVPEEHELFGFSSKTPKWGWRIASVKRFEKPLPAPVRKGITFTKECRIKV